MREMHWSWEDLESTPEYVRQFCTDFTSIRRRAETAARERAQRQHGGVTS